MVHLKHGDDASSAHDEAETTPEVESQGAGTSLFKALLVLACDLPGVRRETLRALIERFAATDAPILVCRSADIGRIQPLCGVYDVSLLPRLDRWLADGHRTVMGFLDSVGFATMEVPREELLNVNTPADLLLFDR